MISISMRCGQSMYRFRVWPFYARGLSAVALVVGVCTGSAAADPIPVEVWCGGDDALTSHVCGKVQELLKSSPSFTMGRGSKPGTLVVLIPKNVKWKKVDDRTQVFYSVELSTVEGRQLGSSSGSCRDDNLTECAEQILKEAEAAADKMGQLARPDR